MTSNSYTSGALALDEALQIGIPNVNRISVLSPAARSDFFFNKLCVLGSELEQHVQLFMQYLEMGNNGGRFAKWRRFVRQQRAKFYIMRMCISMLLNWKEQS